MDRTAISTFLIVLALGFTACKDKPEEKGELPDNKQGMEMKEITIDDVPIEVRQSMERLESAKDDLESIKKLEDITRKYPGFVLARLNLGALYLQVGNTAKSKEIYQGVLNDFPHAIGATAGLATVESALGNHDGAKKLAEKAIEGGYRWAFCYEVIGAAEEAAGNKSAAADAYLAGYRQSPHAWDLLEKVCRLKGRKFIPPTKDGPLFLTKKQIKDLADFVDRMLNTTGKGGGVEGCDHTFRYTEKWAETNKVDLIDLYQFLNRHGGFCDCEVCYNVTTLLDEDE